MLQNVLIVVIAVLPTRIIEPSTHWTFTCSKSAIEIVEQGIKSVQS